MVETAEELELEVEPEEGTEWPKSHNQIEWMRSCFLWRSRESGFLRWNLLLGKILGRLTTKNVEYYMNLAEKIIGVA